MTNHPSTTAGDSQCAIILATLQKRAGDWVALPLLMRVSRSAAVHSRIADLRARGHRIDHHNLRKGRQIHSYYRLADSPPTTTTND
jgi:hypothetical protein